MQLPLAAHTTQSGKLGALEADELLSLAGGMSGLVFLEAGKRYFRGEGRQPAGLPPEPEGADPAEWQAPLAGCPHASASRHEAGVMSRRMQIPAVTRAWWPQAGSLSALAFAVRLM